MSDSRIGHKLLVLRYTGFYCVYLMGENRKQTLQLWEVIFVDIRTWYAVFGYS